MNSADPTSAQVPGKQPLIRRGGIVCNHLPFELPPRPHALIQHWRDLTFLHWQVDPGCLLPHLPDGLELDLYRGKAYVGVLPFQMKHVRPRMMMPIPGISCFPEFNIRTYVQYRGHGGILFLTLEAQSRFACAHGRHSYGLPYHYSKGHVAVTGDRYRWHTRRVSDGLELAGWCQAIGQRTEAQPGSLEQFLFERYRLYTVHDDQLKTVCTAHDRWQFRHAEATIDGNTLLDSFDLKIADVLQPDLVHVSGGVKALTWSIETVN